MLNWQFFISIVILVSSVSTAPTQFPIKSQSNVPNTTPSSKPSQAPTKSTFQLPTKSPSQFPAKSPTLFPTNLPAIIPSQSPTTKFYSPSKVPSRVPSKQQTIPPTKSASKIPTAGPSKLSASPTQLPKYPPTRIPTISPFTPSATPSQPPKYPPTSNPTVNLFKLSASPTQPPKYSPTNNPTVSPFTPSASPIQPPKYPPSRIPTISPSFSPTKSPNTPPIASIKPTTYTPSMPPTPNIPSNQPQTSNPTTARAGYLNKLFQSYASKQCLTFQSDEQMSIALANFVANLQTNYLRNVNPESGDAFFGLTPFSHYSEDEFKSNKTGYVKSPNANANVGIYVGNYAKYATATVSTTRVDWTGVYTTSVKDQGYCGSCWIFSAVEQIESDFIRVLGKSPTSFTLSEQQVLDCLNSGTYNGCNGGWPAKVYGYSQKSGGLTTEALYPYKAVHSTCKSPITSYANVSAVHYLSTSYSGASETTMANYIQTTGPLSVCIATGGWQSYVSGVLTATTCGTSVNHCVQLVGLDMTYVSPATGKSTPYWILRNQWGTSWGVKGFIFIEYGTNACDITSEVSYVVPMLSRTAGTSSPTNSPTTKPTVTPTTKPTVKPSSTVGPTKPTSFPTSSPTVTPTTATPVVSPTVKPTGYPVASSSPTTYTYPVKVTSSSSTITTGNYISGTWSSTTVSTVYDWIGLYAVSVSSNYDPLWWAYVPFGTTSGYFTTSDTSYSGTSWKVPTSGGPYEFRYFYNSGYTVIGKSASMTIAIVTPTIAPTRLPSRAPLSTPTTSPRVTPTTVPVKVITPTNKPTSSSVYGVSFRVPTTAVVGTCINGSWSSVSSSSTWDWIGLYTVGALSDDTNLIWYNYVLSGGIYSGVFSTCDDTDYYAWTVPSYGGPYELRYFCCDQYYPVLGVSKSISISTAISTTKTPTKFPVITPTKAPATTAITVSVTTSTVVMGGYVTGTWSSTTASSTYDWIGLYTTSASASSSYALWWTYVTSGTTSGSFVTSDNSYHSKWTLPSIGGPYEFRYFCCDSYTISAKSTSFQATITTNSVTITTPTISSRRSYLSGSWANPLGSSYKDWIGLFAIGSTSSFSSALWWTYVTSYTTSGTFSTSDSTYHSVWSVPLNTGTYEFRYFCCNSLSLSSTSASIQIVDNPTSSPVTSYPTPTPVTTLPTPTLIPIIPPTKFPSKLPVNIAPTTRLVTFVVPSAIPVKTYASGSWSSVSGATSLDWIGLFVVGSSSTSDLWWNYVTYGATSGTFTTSSNYYHSKWKVPTSGGPYEFRYFINDGYTQIGKSSSFTITTSIPTAYPTGEPTIAHPPTDSYNYYYYYDYFYNPYTYNDNGF